MLIIAGTLTVDPADRERFLDANAEVVPLARRAAGCLDFVQAADPVGRREAVRHRLDR